MLRENSHKLESPLRFRRTLYIQRACRLSHQSGVVQGCRLLLSGFQNREIESTMCEIGHVPRATFSAVLNACAVFSPVSLDLGGRVPDGSPHDAHRRRESKTSWGFETFLLGQEARSFDRLSIQANGNASATGKPKTNHCNIAPNVPGTRSPEVSSGTSSGCTTGVPTGAIQSKKYTIQFINNDQYTQLLIDHDILHRFAMFQIHSVAGPSV